ncbi:hypothetical protein [Anaerofustis stercorihominis]|uniref:Uncharacterized protein n=1 Tax=Anaerofustis stercorihominis TaxID=214853 RepID=A0A3E3DXK8_9FIRM|nr:hypothetical protein [Anaerofustis stercorihominis]RGD73816.1 hypothetical protein DW687_08550 [Anaerofustis stercorihominis]
MSIEKINLDTLSIVESLDTQPTVTGKELQKKFDEGTKTLAGYINSNLIPVVNDNNNNISDLLTNTAKNSNNIKSLNDSVSSINTNISNLIKTKMFKTKVKADSHGHATGQFAIAMTGYECIGAIAFDVMGTNATNTFFYRMTKNGSWAIGNCEPKTTDVEISIIYLYVKS